MQSFDSHFLYCGSQSIISESHLLLFLLFSFPSKLLHKLWFSLLQDASADILFHLSVSLHGLWNLCTRLAVIPNIRIPSLYTPHAFALFHSELIFIQSAWGFSRRKTESPLLCWYLKASYFNGNASSQLTEVIPWCIMLQFLFSLAFSFVFFTVQRITWFLCFVKRFFQFFSF